MSLAVGKGQAVANDERCAIARLLRLDKVVVLGLEDLSVCGDGVGDEGLGVARLEDAQEGALGAGAAPFAVEIGYPGSREEVYHLAQNPVVVLLRFCFCQQSPTVEGGMVDATGAYFWSWEMAQRRDIKGVYIYRVDGAEDVVGDEEGGGSDECLRREEGRVVGGRGD